ncbi:MAG: hypothetical protein FWF46_02280 [Oscillospiraceae bacterium]|nr:hypothetical protein [Oscillospiraceae bacterium]
MLILRLRLRSLKKEREDQKCVNAMNFINKVKDDLNLDEIKPILIFTYGYKTTELALRMYKEQNNISNS